MRRNPGPGHSRSTLFGAQMVMCFLQAPGPCEIYKVAHYREGVHPRAWHSLPRCEPVPLALAPPQRLEHYHPLLPSRMLSIACTR